MSRHLSGTLKLDHKTIFINESGLYSLILGSRKPIAKKFKHWITSEVLPSIRKHGSYTIPEPVKKRIEIKSIHDEELLTKYDRKNVIYIGYVGRLDGTPEEMYKFGKSSDIYRRELKEHRITFTTFKLIYVEICDNMTNVETLFATLLKSRNLHRVKLVKTSNQKELFTTSIIHPIDKIKEELTKIIKENPTETNQTLTIELKMIKDDHEIKKLELQNENMKLQNENIKTQLEIEKEKTKRYFEHKKRKFENLILRFIMQFYNMTIK